MITYEHLNIDMEGGPIPLYRVLKDDNLVGFIESSELGVYYVPVGHKVYADIVYFNTAREVKQNIESIETSKNTTH